MSLSYHYTFSAPFTATANELLEFLESVEADAKEMGFKPTMVLEAVFDTPERREFARRVVRAIHIEDERLQGVVLPVPEQVRDFSPNARTIFLITGKIIARDIKAVEILLRAKIGEVEQADACAAAQKLVVEQLGERVGIAGNLEGRAARSFDWFDSHG